MFTRSISKLHTTGRKAYGGICGTSFRLVDSNAPHVSADIVMGRTLALELASGFTWSTIECVPDSVQFVESKENLNGATVYRSKLSFTISGDFDDRLNWAMNMQRGNYIIEFNGKSGVKTRMGKSYDGAKMNWNRDKKTTQEKRSEILATFEWTSRYPCPVTF